MCHNLDPREVLFYLNRLGYKNINAAQLKDFMTDLKKLIKYQEYLEQDENEDDAVDYPQRDVFSELYHTGTASSLAKKSTQGKHKEHVITLQIKKPRQHIEKHKNSAINPPVSSSSDRLQSVSESCASNVAVISSFPTLTVSKSQSSVPGTTARTVSSSISVEKKVPKQTNSSKTSFIRPKTKAKPRKSDPVALYHQYKEEWKKIKFPGEHNHSETRWAVREKMLGA